MVRVKAGPSLCTPYTTAAHSGTGLGEQKDPQHRRDLLQLHCARSRCKSLIEPSINYSSPGHVNACAKGLFFVSVMCPGVNDTALGCVWVDAMLHCVPAPAERTHTHTQTCTHLTCVCVLLNLPSKIYFYLPVLNRIHFLLKENDGEEQHCFGVGNDGPISQIL